MIPGRRGLRELERALAAAANGRPASVLLTGGEGTGKTFALEAMGATALRQGFRVGIAEEYASTVPMMLATHIARGLRLPLEAANPAGVLGWITEALKRAPLVGHTVLVGFDSVERYSPADLAVVEDLLHAPPSLHLLTIATLDADAATMRAAPEHLRRFLSRIEADRTVQTVPLQPLNIDEARAFVARAMPEVEVASRFVRDVLELTRGNPALIAMLIAALREVKPDLRAALIVGSVVLSRMELPPALVRRLDPDLASMPPSVAEVLQALAIWGLPATPEELGTLTGFADEPIREALERLEDGGIVQRVPWAKPGTMRFSDPLLALVVARETGSLKRERIAQRAADVAADVLGDLRPDLAWVAAEHLLRGTIPLTDRHAHLIVEAARYLVDRSRFEAARELLQALLARGRAEPGLARVPSEAFALLAEGAARSGAWSEAGAVLLEATAAHNRNAAPDVAALRRSARDHSAHGRDEQALSVYHALLDDGRLPPHERVDVLIDTGRVHSNVGRVEEGLVLHVQAAELATQLGLHEPASEAYLNTASSRMTAGDPAGALADIMRAYALARVARDPSLHARAQFIAGHVLSDAFSLHRGVRWLRKGLTLIESREEYAKVGWMAGRVADSEIELGEWAAARTSAARAVQIDASLHRIRSLRRSRALESLINALSGESGPLDRELQHTFTDDEAFGGPPAFVPDMAARFEHHMLGGDCESALAVIETARRLLQRKPAWVRPLAVDVLPRVVRVAAATGNEALLAAATADLRRLAHAYRGMPAIRVGFIEAHACLASLRGAHARAAREHRVAAGAFEALGYRWRAALARKGGGLALIALGRRDLAEAELQEAHAAFERMGAHPQRDEVRELLRALGHSVRARRRAPTGLTPRQIEIAELAAAALTDAEIARRLHLSRRTVSTHMHNILRRLGLRSRIELQLHELPPAPGA